MNSTAPVANPTAEMLYASTDFSKLNWVENLWAAWYLYFNNPVIATGLASFLLHEVRRVSLASMHARLTRCVPDRLLWALHPVDHH